MKDMKLKHFFFAAILTAGITACSDDDNVVNNQDPTGVQAYMTLQIVGPQGADTRTASNPSGTIGGTQSGDTQTGTTAENTISRVLVLLCDKDQTIKAIYDVKNDLEEISGGVKTPVIATQTGTYQVYVIANPTDALVIALTPTEGTASSTKATGNTIINVTENLMKSDYAATNKFIMFNESNGTDDTAGETIIITEANDYDHPAQCANAICLDRLAVKISSQKGQNLDISGIKTNVAGQESEFDAVASVELKGFKLLNGATQANLQQKWTGTTPTSYPWTNTLITPQLANSTTGYYNHLTSFRTVTTGADGSYTAAQDLYDKVSAYDTQNATAAIYCMENNPTYNGTSITQALNGNTTGLVYQWQVTLTENSNDGKAGKNCFYAYDGNYYGKLSDLINDYPGVVADVTGNDLTAKIKVVENELAAAYAKTGDERQKAISDFRVKYNIKVYTEGIMYYTYYIKDQNYKQVEETGEAAVNYYSVMRNTVYNLTVTELMRIGTDIPGGWNPETDPEDPVDPTNVYMTIQAVANPWVVSKEDITLE